MMGLECLESLRRFEILDLVGGYARMDSVIEILIGWLGIAGAWD